MQLAPNGLLAYLLLVIFLLGCSTEQEPPSEESAEPSRQIPAEPVDDVVARVRAAFADPDRPAEDAEAHARRKPDQVLAFLGAQSGMTGLDMGASTGYYTENLAVALGPDGKVYAQNSPSMLEWRDGAIREGLSARLSGRLPQVEELITTPDDLGLEAEVDIATMVNVFHDTYHGEGENQARAVLQSLYRALKPGGVLGLIDHAGAPGNDNAGLHRMNPEVARSLLRDTGFAIEAESDILANPEDDLSASVFDPDISGRTDRFIIKARKPEN